MIKKNYVFEIFVCIVMLCILFNPQKYSAITYDAILVWAKILVPTLLPFMFFSKLFATFNITKYISKNLEPITKKIYNCPGESGYVFVLSVLSGYPMGAKLCTDLYNNGKMSDGQVYRTTCFTSNTGPMFIMGSIGVGLFYSQIAGVILYLSHIISALLNGLIYRNCFLNNNNFCFKTKENNNNSIVSDSANSILIIGVYICIFYIIAEVMISLKIILPIVKLMQLIGIQVDFTSSLLMGILEMTRGLLSLQAISNNFLIVLPLASFVIGFGGISTYMQAYTFLKQTKISKCFFIKQKTTQALISCVVTFLFCLMI